MTLEDAHQLLKQFDCLKEPSISLADKDSLRQAVSWVAKHSDHQILGVCADSVAEGLAALRQYAIALGYSPDMKVEPLEGTVYIKFNPKSGRSYVDSYSGRHRGVLLSCQSADESGLNEMYGHLPLDLFSDPP